MRQSNNLAIGLYESLGYMIYRRVRGYYGGGPGEKDEDAFGASCSLSPPPSSRAALDEDEHGPVGSHTHVTTISDSFSVMRACRHA